MNNNNQVKPPARHQRILRLDANTVIHFLRQHAPDPVSESISLDFIEIPEGVRVLAVYFNHVRACFEFILEHASFDQVPEGEVLPVHPLMRRCVRLQAAKIPHITFSE